MRLCARETRRGCKGALDGPLDPAGETRARARGRGPLNPCGAERAEVPLLALCGGVDRITNAMGKSPRSLLGARGAIQASQCPRFDNVELCDKRSHGGPQAGNLYIAAERPHPAGSARRAKEESTAAASGVASALVAAALDEHINQLHDLTLLSGVKLLNLLQAARQPGVAGAQCGGLQRNCAEQFIGGHVQRLGECGQVRLGGCLDWLS